VGTIAVLYLDALNIIHLGHVLRKATQAKFAMNMHVPSRSKLLIFGAQCAKGCTPTLCLVYNKGLKNICKRSSCAVHD
jgi:hypothetical protein